MLAIANLPTQDWYVNALTLGPEPTARMIKYVVANKAVYMQVAVKSKSGTIQPWGDELLVTPETNIITDAQGVRFRSALPGVPAQVVAQLLEPGDPTIGSGTPFSATLSGSGGIQPGVSSVQVQKNGALVGTEPTLDFVDSASFLWAIADDVPNARVTVTPPSVIAARAGQNAAQSIPNSAFTTVAFDTKLFDTSPGNNIWVAGNPTVMTVRTAGIYVVTAFVQFASAGGVERIVTLLANGAGMGASAQIAPVIGDNTGVSTSTIWQAAVNDTISINVFQNSGGALNIFSALAIARQG